MLATMKAAAVVVTLAACTSSPPPTPGGEVYTYAIDHLSIPTNNTEARQLAFDVDGDGVVDNQLGQVFGTAFGMGFDVQTPTQGDIDSGAIGLLASLQTRDFVTANDAGFTILFGDRQPDSSYTLAVDSPAYTPLVGNATQATFSLGPGELDVRIAFVEPSLVVTLPIEHAFVQLGSVSDASMIGAVGGAVPRPALDTVLLPSVAVAFEDIVERDCGKPNSEKCGCVPYSVGALVIDQFDTTPDCHITLDDIKYNDVVTALLGPDLYFDNKPYVSIGLGFSAVATRLD